MLAVMKITRKLEKKTNHIVDICIIGTGNIALRHYHNIVNLDSKARIIMCKRSDLKINDIIVKNKIQITTNINNIYPKSKKSLAIICSPATSHINDAILLSKKGFHIFVEKPLSHNMRNIKVLNKILETNKTQSLVGYNMRFTDRFEFLKNYLDLKNHENIKKVDVHAYTDFRKWRHNKNYKNTVTINKRLGGGVINELSHEIDYIIFLFKKPNSVYVKCFNGTNKKIDVDCNIKAIFEYKKLCFNVIFKLNMLSKKNKRSLKLIINNTKIHVDHLANSIKIDNKKLLFKDHVDESYVREIEDIRNAILTKSTTRLSIKNSYSTQQVITAMQKSLNNNKKVNLRS